MSPRGRELGMRELGLKKCAFREEKKMNGVCPFGVAQRFFRGLKRAVSPYVLIAIRRSFRSSHGFEAEGDLEGMGGETDPGVAEEEAEQQPRSPGLRGADAQGHYRGEWRDRAALGAAKGRGVWDGLARGCHAGVVELLTHDWCSRRWWHFFFFL